MLTIEQALQSILEHIRVMEAETRPLSKCLGQVAAEDVCAEFTLPQTAISGLDGYAVRSADIAGAGRDNPVTLRITGTVRAGRLPQKTVGPGAAVRIMTGSALPAGADCVVMFEDTDEPGDKNGPNRGNPAEVKILVSVKPGANVRPAGCNVNKGSLVVPRGTVIGPAQVSALAAIGRASARVIRRPVFAVIATGDELASPGRPVAPGKAYNCNAAAVAAMVSHYGGIPRVLGIARDNEASLLVRMQAGLGADAIVTTGGVSRGDYDLVRLIVERLGRVVFKRVKMGPGRAFAFGTLDRENGRNPIPLFALTGPPNGCLNNFEMLVRPAMLKMLGFARWEHPMVEAVAEDGVSSRRPVAFVKWTKLYEDGTGYRVVLNCPEGTGPFEEMAMANSLTIIPEGTEVKKGDRIKVLPLDWCRGQQG